MKTKFKFIHFVDVTHMATKPRKTKIFSCRNNNSNDELGIVKWYSGWRQYCFFPVWDDVVFSAGCLDDITEFMKQL